MVGTRAYRRNLGEGLYTFTGYGTEYARTKYECYIDMEEKLLESNVGYRTGVDGHWVGGHGNFLSMKHSFSGGISGIHLQSGLSGWVESYTGPLFPHFHQLGASNFSAGVPSSKTQLHGLGATAIARVRPTQPQISLPTMIGELKADGLPALAGSSFIRDRAHFFRSLPKDTAEENLNYQFGWKPFISDIRSLAEIVAKSEKIISDYVSSANKPITRAYSFPTESAISTETTTGATSPVGGYTYFSSGSHPLVIQTSDERRRWFKGQFLYSTPVGSSTRARLERYSQEANRLLGARLTPEVLWNLAPWSWAADWYTNIGDIVANLSSFANDGLVMTYGHMMETHTVSRAYSMSGLQPKYGSSIGLSSHFTTTWKQRRGASPFGFAFDDSSMTTRQRAILASLAVARSNRQARRM